VCRRPKRPIEYPIELGFGAFSRLLPFSDQAFSLSGWHVTFVTDSQGAVTHFLGQAAEGETKGVRRK
jgi:hypothetical protein